VENPRIEKVNNKKKDREFSSIILSPQKCLKTFVKDLYKHRSRFSRRNPCTCYSLLTGCPWTRPSATM